MMKAPRQDLTQVLTQRVGKAVKQVLKQARHRAITRDGSGSKWALKVLPQSGGLARIALAAAMAASFFLPCTASAQSAATYPSRPIRIVVTFTPGGAPDILARLLSEKFTAAWGQPVIVDNKPGAGGNIGADQVAKSAPDGYTLVVGTVGTHAINGALYARMPYDMVKDFTPVSLLATTPNMLVINTDVPAKNLAEFIALGKKEGHMSFASSGSGTSIHVSGELFKTMTGIDMQHIPYKGRASAIPDLLGGRVTMMFDNMPSSLPLVRDGKLRALGVTSLKRAAAAPEIPTIAEQGLPGFDAVSWFALFSAPNTPKPIVDKIQAEVTRILKSPDVAKRLSDLGLEPVGSTSDELATYQRAEIQKWSKVVKDSGAKVE
jgi:tripartite-type tricarboxylate transporter receptor subunit TctC